MESQLNHPSGREITKATFLIATTGAKVVLAFKKQNNNSPVLINFKNRNRDFRGLDETIFSIIEIAVKEGVEKTAPHNPGYVWNAMKEIEKWLDPGIIKDPVYKTEALDYIEGRIY